MNSGKGVFSAPPSVAFQIEFKPSSSHKGKVAGLVGEVEITGDDLFTKSIISATDEAIDTTLPDDESISEEDGEVK